MKLLRSAHFAPKKLTVLDREESNLLSSFFAGYQKPGIFVDVGANRPSNAISKPLLENGWHGITVEPIPENAKALLDAGWKIVEQVAVTSPELRINDSAMLHYAGPGGEHSSLSVEGIDPRSLGNHRTITVPLRTLNELLEKHRISDINLLSIDTEGTGLDVLKGIDFESHQVELLLIEDWLRDTKIHRYLSGKGYKLILRSGFNNWYVPTGTKISLPFFGRVKLWKKTNLSVHNNRFKNWVLRKRLKR